SPDVDRLTVGCVGATSPAHRVDVGQQTWIEIRRGVAGGTFAGGWIYSVRAARYHRQPYRFDALPLLHVCRGIWGQHGRAHVSELVDDIVIGRVDARGYSPVRDPVINAILCLHLHDLIGDRVHRGDLCPEIGDVEFVVCAWNDRVVSYAELVVHGPDT